jgi:hypothetical protein
MSDSFNLDNTYWDRSNGFITEMRVDNRWLLRSSVNQKPLGSLRIVSHPDLKPGYLRSIFSYVTSIKDKNEHEILKTVEDYQMDVAELEVYSVDQDIETETKIFEAPFRELEELFGVKVEFQ